MAAVIFGSFGPSRTATASKEASQARPNRTESRDPNFENYDIRADKRAADKIAGLRAKANKSASHVADVRDRLVAGENRLKEKVRSLKVEYNPHSRTPEVIGSDVARGRESLTPADSRSRGQILRSFAREHSDLLGLDEAESDRLKLVADYANPSGDLAFAELRQEINGIPVFGGSIKAGFTKRGEIIRVINNLAAGAERDSVPADFGNADSALRAAAAHINHELKPNETRPRGRQNLSADTRVDFGSGNWGPTAEKIYFPAEPGVLVPAWQVLIWKPTNAYYVVVDAQDGTMLWRKNISEDQTQAASYNVFSNFNAMIPVAASPFPFKPGPTNPTLGSQGSAIARTIVTRVGNESPYGFNNLGWIPDDRNETDGNNVEAGLDRDETPGVDEINGKAASGSRVFDFPLNPGNPNTNTGDAPVPAGEAISPCSSIAQPHGMNDAQRAAVTQLFYVSNWFHDETYRLGFTESAGNFQDDNFGRGGVGGDRVSAEAQDCSGVNNANFSTPNDGQRGRMQMYIWTGPNPDFDGDLDADVVIHELTHGLSNRLHNNSNGLTTNMARGMGEGWSDFYAHCLLSEPSDPINGIYTIGGYATYRIQGTVFTGNNFYGIRRFPKAVISFTGGPQNRPFNPLTFADADQTQFNIDDGAFPRNQFVGSHVVDQVHNLGEIWSSALWEVRALMIARLGWAVGNRKVLQIVTDGMKLSPSNPTFLQARDAIIAAAQANPAAPEASADVADVWSGFAARGMGASAVVLNPGTGNGDTRVIEAFDFPNLAQTASITISDPAGNNNSYPEPGETITLSIPLSNVTGSVASGVTLQIAGGGSANYGSIPSGATITQNVSFTVPPGTQCGTSLNLTLNVSSSLGAASFTRTILIGMPLAVSSEDFDSVTAPAFPAGWEVASEQGGIAFVTSTASSDSGSNSAYAAAPSTIGGATSLTSPPMLVSDQAATVSFRHRFDTEANWDGGVLEISMSGGAFQDIVAAGGRFISGGYNSRLGPGANNPLGNRSAWTGSSGGYITTSVQLPTSAAGQTVQFRWRFGADNSIGGVGWYVDTIRIVRSYQCSTTSAPLSRSPFDFDGDAKTDVSIFRPSGGEWWYLASASGTARAAQFGVSSDVLAAADFTGDRKTDIAFFRPSSGMWFILRSEDSSFYAFPFGADGDIPVPADYDSDGKADAAVYRPSSGLWFVFRSTDSGVTATQFGVAGDRPVPADYDGDGRSDLAVFRPSGSSGGAEWWIQRSRDGLFAASFGNSTDKAVPGDWTGDGKSDVALFRPAAGQWFILRSEDQSFFAFQFGISTDIPAPGDYDGDGKFDAAVFRPSNQTWFLNRSTQGPTGVTFGLSGDKPVPGSFVR